MEREKVGDGEEETSAVHLLLAIGSKALTLSLGMKEVKQADDS
jgi:hypothetical protein